MKAFSLGIGALAMVLFIAGTLGARTAYADAGIHVANGSNVTADNCSGCHRTHTAAGTKLLTAAQPQLCYNCHGTGQTGSVLDVQGGLQAGGGNNKLRGGGFVTAYINTGAPTGQVANTPPISTSYVNTTGVVPTAAASAVVTSTHSVDLSAQKVWGNGAIQAGAQTYVTTNLTCGSCHDPHGNGQFRILRPQPLLNNGTAGTAAVGTSLAGDLKVYTTTNYWQAWQTATEQSNGVAPATTYSTNVSAWCTNCHTRYLAASGSAATSSTDSLFTFRHSTQKSANGSPTCAQCHVAHESNASMAGTYSNAVLQPDGTSTTTKGRLLRIDNRGVCQMCHNR